jgi:hypothetical protein
MAAKVSKLGLRLSNCLLATAGRNGVARRLADRGWGKAPQVVSLEDARQPLAEITDKERLERIQALFETVRLRRLAAEAARLKAWGGGYG